MPIEIESPEQLGYDTITNNLSESSVADRRLADLGLDLDLDELLLCYGDHLGDPCQPVDEQSKRRDEHRNGLRVGHRRKRRERFLAEFVCFDHRDQLRDRFFGFRSRE